MGRVARKWGRKYTDRTLKRVAQLAAVVLLAIVSAVDPCVLEYLKWSLLHGGCSSAGFDTRLMVIRPMVALEILYRYNWDAQDAVAALGICAGHILLQRARSVQLRRHGAIGSVYGGNSEHRTMDMLRSAEEFGSKALYVLSVVAVLAEPDLLPAGWRAFGKGSVSAMTPDLDKMAFSQLFEFTDGVMSYATDQACAHFNNMDVLRAAADTMKAYVSGWAVQPRDEPRTTRRVNTHRLSESLTRSPYISLHLLHTHAIATPLDVVSQCADAPPSLGDTGQIASGDHLESPDSTELRPFIFSSSSLTQLALTRVRG